MRSDTPRFLDCGEAALSWNSATASIPPINARVLALDARLRAAPPAGLRETTPDLSLADPALRAAGNFPRRAGRGDRSSDRALRASRRRSPLRAGPFPAAMIPPSRRTLRSGRRCSVAGASLAAAARGRRLSRLYVWLRAGLVLSRRPARGARDPAARQPARADAAGRRADRRRALLDRRHSHADRLVCHRAHARAAVRAATATRPF